MLKIRAKQVIILIQGSGFDVFYIYSRFGYRNMNDSISFLDALLLHAFNNEASMFVLLVFFLLSNKYYNTCNKSHLLKFPQLCICVLQLHVGAMCYS